MLARSTANRVLQVVLAFALLASGVALVQPATMSVRAEPAPAVAMQSVNGYLRFNPQLASDYAKQYTSGSSRFSNSDGCYIVTTSGLCGLNPNEPPGEIPDTFDNPHFTACAVNAGGLAQTEEGRNTCGPDAQAYAGNMAQNIIAAYSQLLPSVTTMRAGWNRLPQGQAPQEGDLAFLVLPGSSTPCFSGVVYATIDSPTIVTDTSSLRIASHSPSSADIDLNFNGVNCLDRSNTPSFFYIRINGDYTAPVLPPQDITLPYTGGPQTITWPIATDFGPEGTIEQAGVASYRLRVGTTDITTDDPNPQANLDLGMCSTNSYEIVITDGVGNVGTATLTVKVLQQGDLNGDGQVNELDLAILQRWIAEGSTERVGDLNGDGLLTADDELVLFTRLGETCTITLN